MHSEGPFTAGRCYPSSAGRASHDLLPFEDFSPRALALCFHRPPFMGFNMTPNRGPSSCLLCKVSKSPKVGVPLSRAAFLREVFSPCRSPANKFTALRFGLSVAALCAPTEDHDGAPFRRSQPRWGDFFSINSERIWKYFGFPLVRNLLPHFFHRRFFSANRETIGGTAPKLSEITNDPT